MTAEQVEYLRIEFERQVVWHQRQARELARGDASSEEERRDNRVRSERAVWRAETWMQAFGVIRKG